MNLSLTEDQILLRDTFAKLFQQESSPERVRAVEPLGFDPALWRQLVDLGVPMMRVPEDAGGAGFNLMDAAVLVEQAGRHLASAPVMVALVAGRLLAHKDNAPEAAQWLQRFASGDAFIAVAARNVSRTGTQIIQGGAIADAVLCIDGDKLTLVHGGEHKALSNIGDYPLARWQLDGSGPEQRIVLAQGVAVVKLCEGALEELKLLTAVYMSAMGRKALEMAAEYSNQREAFGRLIGSYQGLAHPMADSATEIDGAMLLCWRAIWAIANNKSNAAAYTSMAYVWAAGANSQATARALHLFGGYGLSLEYDIQLYFRRSKALPLVCCSPAIELEHVAQRLWHGAEVALPPAGDVTIDFDYGEEAEEFAEITRKFFAENLDDDLRARAHHSWRGHDAGFQKKLAQAGLLFPDWPEESGGQGRDRYQMTAMAKVFNENRWTRNAIAVSDMVGGAVLAFGSDALKQEVLPPLTSGEKICCLGFSEPGCGSDVFAAQTKAEADGDDWIISGSKMFTSGAELSDYVLILTRTDPKADKHMGLTMFLLPMTSKGIEIQAVETLADERTNITYYDNVRVSDKYRIGEVNGGVTVMAASLSKEQDGGWYGWELRRMLDAAVLWAQTPNDEGKLPMDIPAIRLELAETAVHAAVADVLCRRNLWAQAEKLKDRSAGPMSKLFASEFYIRDSARLMNMIGADSVLSGDDAIHSFELDSRLSTATSIYAGSSEIMRSLIAENSLKMPRTRS